MKIKCGTDIIEISRIKQSIEKLGDTFIKKIYTEDEIAYCESKGKQKYQHYAARFSAKEAAFKAISSELTDKYSLDWKDYEVSVGIEGKPYITIKGINMENIESIDISLSHCKEHAIAVVTVLYKK